MAHTDQDRAALRIPLNPRSGVPLHIQIRRGIQREIERGRFGPGDQLPTVQDLARRHRLSTQTVMRAYTELTRTGLVDARRGSGTYVAEQGVRSTQVLLPAWCGEDRGLPSAALYRQLLEGLRRGFDQPDRRFCVAHIEGAELTGQEVIDVAAACRADSIVAYGPEWADAVDLSEIGQEAATVSLLSHGVAVGVDAVDVGPDDALRTMLTVRVQAGVREFAFVGYDLLLYRSWGDSVYGRIFRVFREFLSGAGIAPRVCVARGKSQQEAQSEILAGAAAFAPGSTVLAATPSIGQLIDPEGARFDMISYTESRETLKALSGKVSLMYQGIDESAAAAARLAAERMGGESGIAPRRLVLQPAICEAGRRGDHERC